MNAPDTRADVLPWTVAFSAVVVCALLTRVALFDADNADLRDHFLVWLERIQRLGFWTAVAEPFSAHGYTPLYGYLLGLSNALWGAAIDGRWIVKSVSMPFDFVAASLMAWLAHRHWRTMEAAATAFAAVLFAPSVLLNSAAWGQSDLIYGSALLAAVSAVSATRPLLAMLCFGLALAGKAQALWLAPFALLLLWRGDLPWRAVLIVPLVYALLALPVVLAGRDALEVAMIYATQASTQHALSLGAPNIHFFLARWAAPWAGAIAPLSALMAVAFGLAFAWSGRRLPPGPMPTETLLLAALLSAMWMPQLLPHMHERYFLPAELLAIALALVNARWWPLAATLQIIALVSYSPFLLGASLAPEPVSGWLARLGFTNSMQPLTGLLALASLVNLALALWLLRAWIATLREPRRPDSLRGATLEACPS